MDKGNALKLSARYLQRLRDNDIKFSEAWILFPLRVTRRGLGGNQDRSRQALFRNLSARVG